MGGDFEIFFSEALYLIGVCNVAVNRRGHPDTHNSAILFIICAKTSERSFVCKKLYFKDREN